MFDWLHYIRQPTLPVPKLSPRKWKPALSPFLSRKWKHGFELGFTLFWLRIAMKRFDHGEQIFCWRQCPWNSGTASAQLSYYCKLAWLASTKAPKHVLNFQQSLITYLQEQIHMTNFLWQMKLTCQFNNQRHL